MWRVVSEAEPEARGSSEEDVTAVVHKKEDEA